MRIIGIAGPPRAGKDTLCRALIRAFAAHGVRAVRLALADPIWDAVSAVAGAPVDRHANTKDEPRADLADRTPREWALAIGRGVRAEAGGDVWLRLWQARAAVSGADVVIAPDVRTLRELRHFSNAGTLLGLDASFAQRDAMLPANWRQFCSRGRFHDTALAPEEFDAIAEKWLPLLSSQSDLTPKDCPGCVGRTRYEGDGFTCRRCGA